MEKVVLSKTEVFLSKASLFYKDICPEQARFLMQKQQMNGPALPDTMLCPFCFQWRRPGEYRVRLQPKCRPSVRIRKLLRREKAHKRLSSQEIKLLQRFRRSSNILAEGDWNVLPMLEQKELIHRAIESSQVSVMAWALVAGGVQEVCQWLRLERNWHLVLKRSFMKPLLFDPIRSFHANVSSQLAELLRLVIVLEVVRNPA
ncbi:UPF0711 protein C18orf21 homolog isoform X1 [Tachysurus ichikawai]